MDSATGARQQMHIGEMASRTGLSLRTLRHYDEIGLLRPSGRTEGGFRLYSDTDLERLLLIRTLKPLGFSLETTGELLGMLDQLGALDEAGTSDEAGPLGSDAARTILRRQLDEFVEEALDRRRTLARQLELADELIAILRSRLASSDPKPTSPSRLSDTSPT